MEELKKYKIKFVPYICGQRADIKKVKLHSVNPKIINYGIKIPHMESCNITFYSFSDTDIIFKAMKFFECELKNEYKNTKFDMKDYSFESDIISYVIDNINGIPISEYCEAQNMNNY